VTSSSRRGASAFGIDQLLGLSRCRRDDVIVTSFPPPPCDDIVTSFPPVPPCRRSTAEEVEDWTKTSSPSLDSLRRPPDLRLPSRPLSIASLCRCSTAEEVEDWTKTSSSPSSSESFRRPPDPRLPSQFPQCRRSTTTGEIKDRTAASSSASLLESLTRPVVGE